MSTRILDNYRLSVVNDSALFNLLAEIYRSDTAREADLAARTSVSQGELNKSLVRLYRANFIMTLPAGRWKVTSFAEELLSYMGIGEVVANAIFDEQRLNKEDATFLRACTGSRHLHDYRWSRDMAANFRASEEAFKLSAQDGRVKKADKVRTFYALAVGADPSAGKLDPELYCNDIMINAATFEDKISRSFYDDSSKRKSTQFFVNRWEMGLDDFRSSNNFLLTGKSERTGDAILFITRARLLANLSQRRDAGNLGTIYQIDKKVFERGVDLCFRSAIEQVESVKNEYFESLLEPSGAEGPKERMTQLIQKLVDAVVGGRGERETRLLEPPEPPKVGSNAVTSIYDLRGEISKGALDTLSGEEKKELIGALMSTTRVAHRRFKARGKG